MANITDARVVQFSKVVESLAGSYVQLYTLAKQIGVNWTAFNLADTIVAGGPEIGSRSLDPAASTPTCDQVLAVKALADAVIVYLEANANEKLNQLAVMTNQTPIGG